jgi:hypothetical protein
MNGEEEGVKDEVVVTYCFGIRLKGLKTATEISK